MGRASVSLLRTLRCYELSEMLLLEAASVNFICYLSSGNQLQWSLTPARESVVDID